ncbi:MAG: Rha family transcriptional regulator [Ruminococcus sp.]|nr:Rha family transcriptional regulator [Ruminococcus sp.]
MNEITITNTNGVLTVSSLQIAKDFNKRHTDVYETIETLIRGCAENSADPQTKGLKFKVSDYFIETKYQNPQNKQWYKCYDITRDGFSLLVMGFTGKKALEWKLKYIEAFNSMERQLININSDIDKYIDSVLDERIETIVSKVIDEKIKIINENTDRKADSIIKAVKESIIETSFATAQSLIPCFMYTHKKLKNK